MGRSDDGSLVPWREILAHEETEFAARESSVLEAVVSDRERAAFAVERDRIAEQRDELAAASDRRAAVRDASAVDRDVRATERDRVHLDLAEGRGFADRFLSAGNRDDSAGDRVDARDDRRRADADRAVAAQSRYSAAADREGAVLAAGVATHELERLRDALEMRMVLGQALGIMMERHGLDADRALAMLVRLSRDAGVKVQVLAEGLVAIAATEFPAPPWNASR